MHCGAHPMLNHRNTPRGSRTLANISILTHSIFSDLFIFLRFYLFINETHTHTHTHTQRERERGRHRQREKQAPWREPDVGLDPGSPGSHPGLKAALNR